MAQEGDIRFQAFWDSYPPRNGKKLEKPETRRRFLALPAAEQFLAIQAARHYAASERVRDGVGIKDPKRFLRDGMGNEPWRDWLDPEQPKAASVNCNGASPRSSRPTQVVL